MVDKFNLIFSKSAAARILSVAANKVAGFKQFAFVCWVWITGKRPTFISKRAFAAHFAKYRQQQAQGLKAEQWPEVRHWWNVSNPSKGSRYPVVMGSAGPVCRCEDYHNQQEILGKGCCKHGYAVLRALGYGSLQDYLATV